ncbi:hypothetical protein B0H19DRAFT_126664 [Mycena capillaripes]|nr:hypothetical protein B0H19DRAFT_126664 [Mycena capillaripes]
MIPTVGFIFFLTLALFSFHDSVIHVQARLVSRPRRDANVRRNTTSAGDITSASWIWVPTSNGLASTSAGNVAFLKNITTPSGKTASSAIISMTAVDNFTLFVNGQPIGASKYAQDGWKSAVVLRAALNASVNMFSVLVANGGGPGAPPPGLLMSIQVLYTNSTNSTFTSDSSWLAASNIPSDFPTPSDLSHFEAAVAAPYGSGLWGHNVSLPTPDPTPLTLNDSHWIWSTANASTAADDGTVGFRKTFTTPSGKIAQTATILLTVDNSFALYVNDLYVGAPPQSPASIFQYAQRFAVNLNATSNVFTVIAQNHPSDATPQDAAGFIAAIRVFYQDGASDIIRTESSWLNGNVTSLPAFLSTDDALLSPSIVQGPMGMAPWGQLGGISDALNAASVPAPPFSSPNAPTSPDPGAPSSSASAPASATPSVDSASHRVPLGAIVGAGVGGLVILALLVALLIWRCRRQAADKDMKAFDIIVPYSKLGSTIPTDESPILRPPPTHLWKTGPAVGNRSAVSQG